MMMFLDKVALAIATVIGLSGLAQAAETEGRAVFYLGGGQQAHVGPDENDSTPLSFGLMVRSAQSKAIYGFDIGREGTVLDSTYNQNEAANAAMSINFLLGANVIDKSAFKTDVALLVGVKEATKDCADSYIGFACYADSAPDVSYEANVGGVVTLSYNSLVLGLRATKESSQIMVGVRF